MREPVRMHSVTGSGPVGIWLSGSSGSWKRRRNASGWEKSQATGMFMAEAIDSRIVLDGSVVSASISSSRGSAILAVVARPWSDKPLDRRQACMCDPMGMADSTEFRLGSQPGSPDYQRTALNISMTYDEILAVEDE